MPSPSSFSAQVRFTHALNIVRSIPSDSSLQPVTADKLQFYGLYKQATEGDVNVPKPSSRHVAEYAKWKAWNRMKGFSPIEAQSLYVESVIQLLTEIMYRYPNHKEVTFIKKALNSFAQEEDIFQDAYEPTEFEYQGHFLNHIEEPDQFMQHHQGILSPSSSSSYHYPLTPITSPGQHAATGKWIMQQQQNKSYVHSSDFLTKGDILSEPDTIDREVAAVTANLSLSSPRHSPYTPHSTKKSLNKASSSSTSTSSRRQKKKSDRALLEKLQTEITALTEQVDRLRARVNHQKSLSTSTSFTHILKVLFKHFMANSAILCIAFYILYKSKSPVAYFIIDYMTPIIQVMMRKFLHKIVHLN